MKRKKSIIELLGFIIKVLILFCFIYEFVPFFVPSSLFSSRKMAFLIAAAYFFIKGYSIKAYLKDKYYKRVFLIIIACIVYNVFLLNTFNGNGTSGLSWYILFFLYSILGSLFFAGLFDWQIKKLLYAVAIVTVFQAVWSILSFYFYDIKLLNAMLFQLSEDENIDYISTARLRSIGGEGAALSVCIALSSYSFLYFIIKGEKVILNIFFLLICTFATILAGTTGMLILTMSIPVTLYLTMRKKKEGILYVAIILLGFFALYSNMSSFWDEEQYERLTSKYISIFNERTQDTTVEALYNQEVPSISVQTTIGTGLTRGNVLSVRCNHDGGYARNYFCLGLIMVVIMYFVIYQLMYKCSRRLPPPIRYLLYIYTLICMGIEYKEPFMFYFVPFFIFISLYLCEYQNQTQNKINYCNI